MMDALNNSTTTSSARQSEIPAGKAQRSKKGQSQETNGDFNAELSAAGQAQAKAQPQALPKPTGESPALDASRKLGVKNNAERSPVTQTPAASLKTAAVVTGLKPWSRDWVMEGSENPAADAAVPTKTLFGEGSKPGTISDDLSEMIRKAEASLASTEREIAAQTGKPGQAAGVAGASAGLAALAADGSRGDSEKVDRMVGQKSQGGVLQQGLQSQLGALNGDILAISDEGLGAGASTAADQPGQLSGAEFLSTLGAARAGARGGQEQAQSNLSERGFNGKPTFKTIEGGRKPLNVEGRDDYALMQALGPQQRTAQLGAGMIAPTLMDGRVTQGSMTRNRLTSEALLNMSNGISSFVGQKGGEMKVRLKPDGMGELHLRVQTRGNDVRLQIQASDENAKKVIEESLPHLKDKLASQSLNLGRVEVAVAHDLRQDSSQQQSQNQNYQQHSMNDWMGQDNRNGQGGRSSWSDQESGWDARPQAARSTARAGVSALTSAQSLKSGESGRLDVRA